MAHTTIRDVARAAKVSIATGKIAGFEALARIGAPQNLSGPGPYIDLAERTSRIDALTFAMMRSVAKLVAGFNDITDGDNGAYAAKKGWDACTGWGSPNGAALIAALDTPTAVPPATQ